METGAASALALVPVGGALGGLFLGLLDLLLELGPLCPPPGRRRLLPGAFLAALPAAGGARGLVPDELGLLGGLQLLLALELVADALALPDADERAGDDVNVEPAG